MGPVSSRGTPVAAKRPGDYGLEVSVTSVAYLTSDERPGVLYCAVMFDMELKNFERFNSSEIPFRAQLATSQADTTPHLATNATPNRPSPSNFDIAFIYPSREEIVRLGTQKVKSTKHGTPDISMSPPIVGEISFSGIGKDSEEEGLKVEILRRHGLTPAPEINNTALPLHWNFFNDSKGSYPSIHTIIVLVSCTGTAGERPPVFSFKLTLLSSFKVKAQGKPYVSMFRKPDGWTFSIDGNYEPDRLDRMLKAYRDRQDYFKNITLEKLAENLHTR
ncbi:hypothetical protein GGX14DRAFT_653642 [Mycena pura]|uniref:Uncharacterized protein n=1 Tax=Mycena pura TaxID=153505 RepID=A0AAD6YAL8_9AGAR|nr:hypothetical protein GGX14DRAFT_653642 [Mycena pura]